MDELLKIANEISKIYTVLANIELCDDKKSLYYLGTIDRLEKKIKQENEIYSKLSSVEIQKILTEIDKVKINSIYARIYCKLVDLTAKYTEEKLRIECINDIYVNQLIFLQDDIDNPKFNALKQKLIVEKYLLIFASPIVEKDLVKNNFDVSNGYSKIYFLTDLLGIPRRLSKSLIDSILINYLETAVNKLLEITDSEYIDDDGIIGSMSCQANIKSILGLLSNEITDCVYDEVKQFEEIPNNISKYALLDILNNRHKNKEKIKRISLSPFDN